MFVLSKQEWFDKAVERAKLDPRRAYNADTGRCSYNRQGDVPGCFVGYACDADTLAILIDGSAGENVDNGHIGVSDFGSPWYGAAFLDSLQGIHDADADREVAPDRWRQDRAEWMPRLKAFADQYGLEWRE